MTTGDQSSGSRRGLDALDALSAAAHSKELAALRRAGFARLLETGAPVSRAAWAEAAGMTAGHMATLLAEPRIATRVQLDDQGRLVGVAGLSTVPTPHRLLLTQGLRWTWCALDAVGIMGALGASGTVRSVDAHTGEELEVVFDGGRPGGEVVLFILGDYGGGNVVEQWCPQVNFFADPANADAWVHARGLEGDVVSVGEIASRAAAMWEPVVAGVSG